MSVMQSTIKGDWKNLLRIWQETGGYDSKAEDVFVSLVVSYEDPPRGYYDARRIEQVVCTVIDTMGEEDGFFTLNPKAVIYAAFYLDVIHQPYAQDNRMRSAHFAADALDKLGYYPGFTNIVVNLIADTLHGTPRSQEAKHLIDADLLIYGSRSREYREFTELLREERPTWADVAWIGYRTREVQALLARERIFWLPANERLEVRAQRNLRNELEDLQRRSP